MLLVGLCDSGKTLLFSRVSWYNTLSITGCSADARHTCGVNVHFLFWQLLSGKFKRTQTSITDSSAPYKAKNDKVSEVYRQVWSFHDEHGLQLSLSLLYSGQHLDPDRPARTWQSSPSIPGEVQICSQVGAGHQHMYITLSVRGEVTNDLIDIMSWSHIFSSSLSLARLSRAIVFVVDSAIFQKEVRDVAEFLYVLLTDTVICRNAPALLVACNKQGATTPPLLWKLPNYLHITSWSSFSAYAWHHYSRISLFYRYHNGKIC